jgi:hypothetical protein
MSISPFPSYALIVILIIEAAREEDIGDTSISGEA